MRWIFLLFLAGCTTTEKGMCLDWKVHEDVREECTPLYGNIICVERKVHTYQCILREDPKEES